MRPERRFKSGMDGGLTAAVLVSPPLHLRTLEILSKRWGPPHNSITGTRSFRAMCLSDERVPAGRVYATIVAGSLVRIPDINIPLPFAILLLPTDHVLHRQNLPPRDT